MRLKTTLITILIVSTTTLGANPQVFKRVQSLIDQGDYAEAREVLEESRLIEQSNPVAFNFLAYAHMLDENYKEAYEYYQKSNQILPTINSLSGLQWSSLALKRYDESIEYGNRVLQKSPGNYYARLQQAAAWLGKGDYNRAANSYDALNRQAPKNGDTWMGAGMAYEAMGETGKAQDMYRQGLTHAPDHPGLKFKTLYATPWLRITPFGSYTEFENSSTKTKSRNYGLGLAWGMNPNWTMDASVQQSYTDRPEATNEYITLEIVNRNPPAGAPANAPSGLGITNSVSILENDGGHYVNDVGSLGLSYTTDSKFITAFGRGFILQSNDPYGDDAGAFYGGIFLGDKDLSLELGAAYMGFQRHLGRQGVIGIHWNIWGPLYSSTQVFGQSIGHLAWSEKRSDSNISVSDYEISYTDNEAYSESFGAAQQTFTLVFDSWRVGGYYRGGELYTPIMASGTSIVYNADRLDEGYGAFFGFNPIPEMDILVNYGIDNWTAVSAETPVSRQISLSLGMVF